MSETNSEQPASGGFATAILLAFGDLLRPLVAAFGSPEAMEYFWYQFGWRVTLDEVALSAITSQLPIGSDAAQVRSIVETIRDALLTGSAPNPADLTRLADAVVEVGESLTRLTPATPAALPAPLDDPASWTDVAERILDYLLERYLQRHRPVPYLILLVTGVLRYDQMPAQPPWRVSHVRPAFDWDQLEALLQSPAAALAHAYRWGDATAPFDHERALDAAGRTLDALGLATEAISPVLTLAPGLPADVDARIRRDVQGLRVTALSGTVPSTLAHYEVGVDLLPAAATADGPVTGVVLRPRLLGGVTDSVPLGAESSVTVAAQADVGAALGVSVQPGDVELTGGDVTAGTAVTLHSSAATDRPWYLVGSADSARIELHNAALTVSLEGPEEPELRLSLRAGQPAAAGAVVVLPLSEADSFVHDSMGSSDIKVGFSPSVVWSSRTGICFNGTTVPRIDIPASVRVGSFLVQKVAVGLAAPHDSDAATPAGVSVQVTLDVSGTLGPVGAVVQGIGFALDIDHYSHDQLAALTAGASRPTLGSVDVHIGFVPPTGIGLAVDAAGLLTGGGFLAHSGDQYAGALDLSIRDIAVKAYGLIQTALPDGTDGYSFIALLSAEFAPAVQLPLGFSLEGVGGLIGINRTLDQDAVAAALWAGHLDGLLFPTDPVAAAPRLLSALNSYFPASPGRYLVGPLAKIGWLSNIVVGKVGLLLELPEPLRILLLGEVAVGVPSAKPILALHISFDGGVDFGKQLAFFDATLHDSYLESYPVTGGLAFRYGWGDEPVFALAVGGFNPHFQPPAAFPTLKRLGISISSSVAKIEAQSYLALTSNTLQFGARVELTAGTGGFNVHGWLGFDALCERDPLSFEIDLTAGVDLRHGTSVIASVHLDGTLSGPTPWHICAKASLSLLFFDVSVSVDKTWGTTATALPPPDPLPALLAAFADPSAWSAVAAVGLRAAITPVAAPPDAGNALLLDPASGLRIAQRAVPLDQPITRFGGASLGRSTSFSVDGLTVSGHQVAATAKATEEFAPAQFLDLTDAEKLSLPSFRRYDAGVTVGGDAVDLGQSSRSRAVRTTIGYDTTIIDSQTAPRPGSQHHPTLEAVLTLAAQTRASTGAGGRYGPVPGAAPRVTLAPEQWVIANTADLVERADLPSDGSKLGALLAMQSHLAANPGDAGSLQLVFTQEAG